MFGRVLILMLMLVRAASAADAPTSIWRVVELNGVPFDARATLDLSDPAKVAGQGPCNRFFAERTGLWPDIHLGGMVATEMACKDLAQEDRYFTALSKVVRGEITVAEVGTALILSGPDGAPRLALIPDGP